jgi:hypothetical protein
MAELTLPMGADTYVLIGPDSDQGAFSSFLPSLMFRVGETYVDPANHRPLLVTSLGNDLVTFLDVSDPFASGEEFTLPLFTARVRLLQNKYIKIRESS